MVKMRRIALPGLEGGFLRPEECFFCDDKHLHLALENAKGELSLVELPLAKLMDLVSDTLIVEVKEAKGEH